MRWIKQQKFISHSSGGQEVQGQGASRVVSGKGSLPSLQMATLSLCPHITGSELLWFLPLLLFFKKYFIYLPDCAKSSEKAMAPHSSPLA